MIHVRGASFLNAVRFVKETYGPEAHAKVLAALPLRHSATFLGPVREGSWEPLEDLLAYTETARRLLAPDHPAFFREMGRYIGRAMARSGFRFFLGSDPLTAVPRTAFMWRFFYDAGRVETVAKGEREIVLQILDFVPSSRAQCERMMGFLEGCCEVLGVDRPRVEENACVVAGAPHCEMRLVWG